MRTAPPLLLPIFRSDSQAAILAACYLAPDERFSLTDLARDNGLSLSTVHREVGLLVSAGLLRQVRVGQARLVSADPASPSYEPLRRLIESAFGAVPLLTQALDAIAGLDAAWIFGSYAARHAGEPGPAPRDVDVVAVVSRDDASTDVYAACSEVGQRLGIDVNAVVYTPQEWADADNIFVSQIRSGPLLPLIAAADEENP